MRKNKSFYIIIGLVLLTMTFLVGCGNRGTLNTPEPEIEETNDVNVEDNENIVDEEISLDIDKAYGFSLVNTDEKLVSLSDFKGKPVVLSFWVSWNEYSIKQLETLQNVYPLLEGDVIFLAINSTSFETKDEENVISYIKDKELDFDVLLDKGGEAARSYYIGSFPTTFFIDGTGTIFKMFTSNIEEDQLLDEVELLLEAH